MSILSAVFSDIKHTLKSLTCTMLQSNSRFWTTMARYTLPSRVWATIESTMSMDVLRAYLLRSLRYPLDISLGTTDPERLRLVAAHAEHWETLKIDVESAEVIPVLDLLQGRLPLLRRVSYRSTVSVPTIAFMDAPRLVEATLECLHASPVLPYEQIQRMRFHCESGHPTPFAIFHLTESLTSLNLGTGCTVPDFARYPRVTLPSLRLLMVHEGFLLDLLTCAQLVELFAVHDEKRSLPFLERSGCALETYISESEALEAEDVVAILRIAPSLADLRLPGMWRLAALLPLLADESPPLAPNLRSISLSGITGSKVCGLVEAMMLSRRN